MFKPDKGIIKIHRFLSSVLEIEDKFVLEDAISYSLDRFIIGIDKFKDNYGVVVYKEVAHFVNFMLPLRDNVSYFRGIYRFKTMARISKHGYAKCGDWLYEYWCADFETPEEVIRFVLRVIFRESE